MAIAIGKLNYGDTAAVEVSARHAGNALTVAAVKAIGVGARQHGQEIILGTDGSRWRYHSTSALTGDDTLVIAPTAGSGRWLRLPGGCRIKLPIAFGTADAAVLLTFQAGQIFRLVEPAWHVTADWTGGTASTIGVSSNKTGFSTKGDILGGAAGNLAAALTAALGVNAPGTVGAGFDTLAKRRVNFTSTDTIRFDRITSAFTAGTGFVVLDGILAANDGA